MIAAVSKLIIFTSVVNRIINASRSRRVTLQVYDTCLQTFDLCTLGHTAPIEAIVQFLSHPYQHVKCDGLHSHGNSILQMRYAERDCACAQNLNTCCFVPCRKLASACVFEAVMADWNRSSHFDTPCTSVPILTSFRAYLICPNTYFVTPSAQFCAYDGEDVFELLNFCDQELMVGHLVDIRTQNSLQKV
jgi:hypothetical protein